ncbi:unnamed protein product, partial [Urochloa humidicola]
IRNTNSDQVIAYSHLHLCSHALANGDGGPQHGCGVHLEGNSTDSVFRLLLTATSSRHSQMRHRLVGDHDQPVSKRALVLQCSCDIVVIQLLLELGLVGACLTQPGSMDHKDDGGCKC